MSDNLNDSQIKYSLNISVNFLNDLYKYPLQNLRIVIKKIHIKKKKWKQAKC